MASLSAASNGAATSVSLALRILALATGAAALVFTANNYLIFWQGWPGVEGLFGHLGWFGAPPLREPLGSGALAKGWIQLLLYAGAVALVAAYATTRRGRSLTADSRLLAATAAYIARAGFWAVFLVGLADMAVSFLRVEGMLVATFGEELATQLGRPSFRGNVVHYPLIGVSLIIAWFNRSLGFTWLALLIVLAEFQIVLARFIFSYEQAFMGDLVRFWYAALFLFASAYTLIEEGHVRVDILYAGFTDRQKAWTNTVGSILLGVPLCWIIMTLGMWDKSNVINAPLLTYEVTQSGYGMYVKYLMAGFLLVYALTMMMQFLGYALRNAAILAGDPDAVPLTPQHAP